MKWHDWIFMGAVTAIYVGLGWNLRGIYEEWKHDRE